MSEKTIRYSVNTHGCNKDWDMKVLTEQFEQQVGTLENVRQHIENGHALCVGVLDGNRKKSNVVGAHWLMLDIDHDISLDVALADPFIRSNAAFIYTTTSHTEKEHRFRIVFILPEFIGDTDVVEQLVELLMHNFPYADQACKDASRVFYGNTGAQFPLWQPDVRINPDWVPAAVEAAEKAKVIYEKRRAEQDLQRAQIRQKLLKDGLNELEMVKLALSHIPGRNVGGGNYSEWTKVLMALSSHYDPSTAIQLAEEWDPASVGTKYDPRMKIRTYHDQGIRIGTLFAIAKQYGFRFPDPEVKPVQTREAKILEEKLEEKEETNYQRVVRLLGPIFECKNLLEQDLELAKLAGLERVGKKQLQNIMAKEYAADQGEGQTHGSLAAFLSTPEEDMEWIIPDILQQDSITLLSSAPGIGKSLLSYELAYQVLSGGTFPLGKVKQGKVLIIQTDEPRKLWKKRMRDRGVGQFGDNVYMMTRWNFNEIGKLQEVMEKFQPTLVIVDHLRNALETTGITEYDPNVGGPIHKLRMLMEEHGAGCILIHHDKKGEADGQDKHSGSRAIQGACSNSFSFKQKSDGSDNLILKCTKSRTENKRSYEFVVDSGEDSWQMVSLGEYQTKNHQQTSIMHRMIKLLQDNPDRFTSAGVKASEIASYLGVDSKAVGIAGKRACELNLLKRYQKNKDDYRSPYFYYIEGSPTPPPLKNEKQPPRTLKPSVHASTEDYKSFNRPSTNQLLTSTDTRIGVTTDQQHISTGDQQGLTGNSTKEVEITPVLNKSESPVDATTLDHSDFGPISSYMEKGGERVSPDWKVIDNPLDVKIGTKVCYWVGDSRVNDQVIRINGDKAVLAVGRTMKMTDLFLDLRGGVQ